MSVGRDLTCQEMVELMTDYLEGALDRATRARFERHLAGCDGCTAYLEQLRVTIAAVGRLRTSDLAPEMRGRLRDAFRGWKQNES